MTLQNYALMISENQTTFNAFDGKNANDNSHLVLDSIKSANFANSDSKLILDFGSGFEVGAGYLFSKLVVDTSGKNALGVDLSRLIPKSDIYHITQQGDKFIVHLAPQHSTIGNIYKSNIHTMNNFWTMSNVMIYPHKFAKKRVVKKKRVIRRAKKTANLNNSIESPLIRHSEPLGEESTNLNNDLDLFALDSYISLDSSLISSLKNDKESAHFAYNDRFFYKNDSINQVTTRRRSQSIPNNNKYYFILTPFINHNLFFESGRYNLSGFDYGFLTAFSGKLTANNALGTHFMMSYGSLSDSKDKDLSIKNLNLNLGLNYKLDLIYDMYLKARGDFYYFLNQAKTLTMFEAIKPNNLGFGASVSYGKDFDFKSGGVLGIEAGLDYKALQSSTISLHDNIYQKQLYHLIYADLGLNYSKYFGNFGVNAGLGIRGNITANKLAKSQIRINNLNRSVDMVLDNDIFLGYANLSASYVLNTKDFDMEFSLAYYGNFGDRAISNAGGFEWRVFW